MSNPREAATRNELEQRLDVIQHRLENLELDRDHWKTEAGRLEKELKSESECSENLSELANERIDQLNRAREQCEELQERLEESEWRLGKAGHFERLVHRRKSLISSLIATIRKKAKANSALKAGLDSLRRFKANAQANEQQLLVQIEQLKSDVGQAREALESYGGSGTMNSRLRKTDERLMIDALEREVALLREQLACQTASVNTNQIQAAAEK